MCVTKEREREKQQMHHVTFHSLFLEVVSMIILSVSEPKLKDQLSLVATPIKLTQHLFRCL